MSSIAHPSRLIRVLGTSSDDGVDRVVHSLAAVVLVLVLALAIAFRHTLLDLLRATERPHPPDTVKASIVLPSGVVGVAHNAGDSPEAARAAVASGASVIEIDVGSVRGRLMATHDPPLPGMPLDAPTLPAIWAITRNADAIELDLKQSSPLFLKPLSASSAPTAGRT